MDPNDPAATEEAPPQPIPLAEPSEAEVVAALPQGCAHAEVPEDADLAAIAAALGLPTGRDATGWGYERGRIWALGVEQAALDAALAEVGTAPPAGPVPAEVPLRNILFALRDGGWISHAEALAAAKTGDMPAALTDTLHAAVAAGALTRGDVDDAELTWAAMYTAVRANPMWNLFVAAGRATPAQVDELFRAAAAVP